MVKPPGEVFFDIRGVHHDHVAVGQVVDEDIVDDTALGTTEQRIVRLSLADRRDVLGSDMLEERQRVTALDLELAHMADIEQTGCAAYRIVLVYDTTVLDRH